MGDGLEISPWVASRVDPLSSEHGTYHTVNPRFWPWPSGEILYPGKVARKRHPPLQLREILLAAVSPLPSE